MHTCPNGKRYVGVTKSDKPEYRWNNGNGYKNQVFGKAVEKYGWDNIEHVTYNCDSEEQMYDFEQRLIIKYDTTNPEHGYNISIGGDKGGDLGKNSGSKGYYREYNQRDEVKEKKREYRQREDIKEKNKEYQKQYYLKKKLEKINNENQLQLYI